MVMSNIPGTFPANTSVKRLLNNVSRHKAYCVLFSFQTDSLNLHFSLGAVSCHSEVTNNVSFSTKSRTN